MTLERRLGEERRSNWRDALEKLHALDSLLKDLDEILLDLYNEGKVHEGEKTEFDQSEFYWADRIKSAVNKFKAKGRKDAND